MPEIAEAGAPFRIGRCVLLDAGGMPFQAGHRPTRGAQGRFQGPPRLISGIGAARWCRLCRPAGGEGVVPFV